MSLSSSLSGIALLLFLSIGSALGAVDPKCVKVLSESQNRSLTKLRLQLDDTREYLDWNESKNLFKRRIAQPNQAQRTELESRSLELWAKHTLSKLKDPLILGRMLFHAADLSDPLGRVLAAALEREARQMPGTPSEVSQLYRAALQDERLLLIAMDQAEESGVGAAFSVVARVGVGILHDPQLSPALKAQLIFEQMGTASWEGVRPLQYVSKSQRDEVGRLLRQRLPLMKVYEQMAKNAGILDFPIDLAVAESLRAVQIPEARHQFFETHVTNLLYAASGEFPNDLLIRYSNGELRGSSIEKELKARFGLIFNPQVKRITYDEAKQQVLDNPNSAVVNVNAFSDVPQFIEKWNVAAAQVGFKGHVRLPTREEYMVATRAGTQTNFFWGNSEEQAPRYAVFGIRSFDPKKLRVATLRSNPLGLKDIVGIARQWASTVVDSSSGTSNALHGGSWVWHASHLSSTITDSYSSSRRSDTFSFRLAVEP